MIASSRQDRIREMIETLQVGNSITIHMFPKELRRFEREYPCVSFEIKSTTDEPNHKSYRVKVSLYM